MSARKDKAFARLREHRRIALSSIAHLKTIRQGKSESFLATVSVLDISESGIKISCPDLSTPKGLPDSVEIKWSPVVGLEPMTLSGDCMWAQGGQLGIRFRECSPRALAVLRSLVKFHLEPVTQTGR